MRHAKSPAQQKERTPQATRLLKPRVAWNSSGIRHRLAGLIPSWADLALGRGALPESSMPLLYLLHYHKADVTSQTFALCSQNDVLHDARQYTGNMGPKTKTPRVTPRGSNLQRYYKEKTGPSSTNCNRRRDTESSDDFGIPLFAVAGEAFPAAERPDNAEKRLRGRPFNTSTGHATPSSASSGHKVVVAGGGVLDGGGTLGAGNVRSGGRPWRLVPSPRFI